MRASQRLQPHSINPRFQCQLGHVTSGHAFLLAVCIIMLPVLMVTAEHARIAATDHMNPMNQQCAHPRHMTFKRAHLMLPSLNNVLPAMALQNEIVKSNIWCLSHSSSHAKVRHVFSSPGLSVPSDLGRMVVGAVVVLLLLISGDIETNPGPVGNKLTSDDLGCVLGEVLDVSADWYDLGLQLKVRTGTLDNIRADFTAAKHRLREMLKAWLTTGDKLSWKNLIDALRSPVVGASQLAAALETKYCPVERTELDVGGHPVTVFPPSPVSEQLPTVMLQETDIRESLRTSPYPHPSPIINKHAPPEIQTAAVRTHPPLPYHHTQGPQCTPELKVFDLYFNKLVESISHPEWLAFQLYSQDMISIKLRDETMKIIGPSTYCKASKLVAAVKDQIMVNSSVLHKFLSVVRGNPSLVYIADAMSDSYRSVLPPKVVNTSLPTPSQLFTELRGFKKWYLLGLKLNISKDTLGFIEKMHDTIDRQCFEMLQHWISNSEKPTLEAIHEALKNIGESVIAEEIARKYNIRPTISREENLPPPSSEHPSSRGEQMSESSSTTKALKPRKVISREQRRIINYFAIVMDKITEIIETMVKLEKLLRFLRFLCHPLNPEMTYIDQHILKSTSSVSEVMECLVPEYINYMETGLLEAIIERFECTEAESLLEEYHDRYPISRLLTDMPNPVSDERLDLTKRKRLRVECNGDIVFESARAFDVKRIRTAIEDATGINHQFVTHAQHSEGSLKLTFLIPESVSAIFQELCDEDLELLAQAGIVELRIDDFVISDIRKYCPQRIESSTQSPNAPSADQSGTTAKGFDSYIDQREEQFTSKEKGQLKSLLECISKSRMEEVCSDSFLQQLAIHMRDWRKLAPHFGISDFKAEELAHCNTDVDEQRYRALYSWKQINPDTGTYKNLIACLLTYAPFDLAEAALMMLTTDAAVQETHKLLKAAYLSEAGCPLWTGAPELLQFDRRLGRVSQYADEKLEGIGYSLTLEPFLSETETKNTDKQLRDIDYSSHFETLEHFSSEIETVSIKSFANSVAKKKDFFFLVKGPPGSGRTALLQRMCSFWARGFCLRKFTLVLWLDLKAHPSAPSSQSLRTLLSCSLPQGSHLDSIQQWLERHGTQDILIVVDGVDGQAYNEWKPFLEWLADTEVSVILTATSPIQIKDPTRSNRNLCQYDLLGLSQDQISKQVIHHYRHDSSRTEEFLMYISEAHDIRALCSSPPYLAAVLFVFDNESARDLPNTWTQLFTSLKHFLFTLSNVSDSVNTNPPTRTKLFSSLKRSFLRQSSVPDHGTLTILASKAYTVTITNSPFDWYRDYTNFCNRVSPPYYTMMSTANRCCFTLPLLQYYLCAQHIHTLPHRQHVLALNEKTVPLHVKRFYVGLCSLSKRTRVILTPKDTFMYAACESEVAINKLKILTSELTFKNQLLTLFGIHHIFQAVHYSGLMCKLEFHQCLFGPLTFQMMAKWLRAYSILPNGGVILKLSLSDNQIKEGAHVVARALQVNQSLQELDLSGNQISNIGAHEFAGALRVNQSLQELDLSYNQISDEGAHEFAGALQVNQSLQKLNLSYNQISDEAACKFAGALQVNQSLQELNLRDNMISAEGVCALVRVFQVNQSLQKLKLSGLSEKNITDELVCALVRELQVKQSHQKLDLSSKKILDKGACALSAALQVNQSLRELDLSSNNISDTGVCALAGALQVNQSLQQLNLSENKISNEGVCALARALQVNQSLQKLNLCNNKIPADGMCALVGALLVNQSLQKLKLAIDLSENKSSAKGVYAVFLALQVNPSLQKLDLSKKDISGKGVGVLSGAIRVNQTLQELDLSENEITSDGLHELAGALQVNQSLQRLNLNGNKILAEGTRILAEALHVNQSLQELNLGSNWISDEGACAVTAALQVNQSLQQLDLGSNQISDKGACAVAAALQVNQSLQQLDLGSNQISDKGACAVAAALQVNQSLQQLDLGYNQISDKGACAVAAALQVNHSLQQLNLRNNKILADGVLVLAGALIVNKNLKLDLSKNGISDEHVCVLVEALKVNQSHQKLKLNLNWTKITDKGACAIATALQVNQSLQKLSLNRNKITNKGACAIATALQVNQSLQQLNLWSNQISDEGACGLATALQVNQNLQELDLSFNQISDKGALKVAGVLQVNQSLQKLYLTGNQISDEGACELAAVLQVNQILQTLYLNGNQISGKGACELAAALQVNQSLQTLNLSGNQISDNGACELAAGLQVNQSLQELSLSRNQISFEGTRELAAALQVNQSLQTLDLGFNHISDEGAYAVATPLEVNQSLQQLNIGYNCISSQGCSFLRKVQLKRKNLKIVGLDQQYLH